MLKCFIVILGIYLLIMTVLSLAKKRMTEQFCLVWGFLSCVMILFGILLNPSELHRYISERGILLIMIAVIVVVYGAWFISTQVSILMRKNQELAMQISLLNQENEQIMKRVQMLEQESLNTEQKGNDS